jgi:hypothetical protein
MAYLRPFGGGHIIKGYRGVDLASDALPFDRLWYVEVSNDNPLCEVLHPITSCGDPRLRFCGQHNRDTRARGRVQRVLSFAKRAETLRHLRLSEPWHSAIAEARKPIAGRALQLINFL